MIDFEAVALDALSCFVNAWANFEDEPIGAEFRGEMVNACEKAVKALNIRAHGEFEETYAATEKTRLTKEIQP